MTASLTSQRCPSVIEEAESTKVILAHGTEYFGDLVVGADGVHNKVREIMRERANKAITHFITAAEKRCTTPLPTPEGQVQS